MGAMAFDAVILAGGAGRRMGGADKAAITVSGETLLDRALGAVKGARRVVVVGPRRPVSTPVEWTREDPPGGGPAHALAAGLRRTTAEVVVVLAVDHPFVQGTTVVRLIEALSEHDGAVIVDSQGHPAIAGAYRGELLRTKLATRGETRGVALKDVLSGLDLRLIADARAATDLDTLERVRAAGATPPGHGER
jgi:molybdopterin-guanine dinucleotide biosynthesis protein A